MISGKWGGDFPPPQQKMSKNKKSLKKRFCKTCQGRTLFNKNKIGDLVCSKCGTIFKDEEKKRPTKIQDENSFMEKFKYLI